VPRRQEEKERWEINTMKDGPVAGSNFSRELIILKACSNKPLQAFSLKK